MWAPCLPARLHTDPEPQALAGALSEHLPLVVWRGLRLSCWTSAPSPARGSLTVY